MDTTYLEEQITALNQEAETIQLSIINRTHEIELLQHGLKFSHKRLKAIEKEREFYQSLQDANTEQKKG